MLFHRWVVFCLNVYPMGRDLLWMCALFTIPSWWKWCRWSVLFTKQLYCVLKSPGPLYDNSLFVMLPMLTVVFGRSNTLGRWEGCQLLVRVALFCGLCSSSKTCKSCCVLKLYHVMCYWRSNSPGQRITMRGCGTHPTLPPHTHVTETWCCNNANLHCNLLTSTILTEQIRLIQQFVSF